MYPRAVTLQLTVVCISFLINFERYAHQKKSPAGPNEQKFWIHTLFIGSHNILFFSLLLCKVSVSNRSSSGTKHFLKLHISTQSGDDDKQQTAIGYNLKQMCTATDDKNWKAKPYVAFCLVFFFIYVYICFVVMLCLLWVSETLHSSSEFKMIVGAKTLCAVLIFIAENRYKSHWLV